MPLSQKRCHTHIFEGWQAPYFGKGLHTLRNLISEAGGWRRAVHYCMTYEYAMAKLIARLIYTTRKRRVLRLMFRAMMQDSCMQDACDDEKAHAGMQQA